MNTLTMTVKDARDLSFTTRDEAVDVVIRLMKERDKLLDALKRTLDECLYPSDTISDIHATVIAAIKAAEQTP